MLVSVIIANYNKGPFIRETIDSVLKQTHEDWELIVVDDASNDNSIEIVSGFCHDPRIKLIKNEGNKGANYSRNEGLKSAKGNYIIFLDADDLLVSDCLSKRLEKANQNPNTDFLIFTMGVFKKTIGDTSGLWRPTSKTPLYDFLKHKLPWSILQPFWKRDFLLGIKGFDLDFQRMQDVELNTRALLVSGVNYKQYDGEPDCYYRIGMERLTFNMEEFLKRFIDSCLLYCQKFEKEVKANERFYMTGTVFRAYLLLLNHYKTKGISKQQFVFLEDRLLNNPGIAELIDGKKRRFSIVKWYNLLSVRIPGVNLVLEKLLVP